MNILYGNGPEIGIPEPEFTSTPSDATSYDSGVITSKNNVIRPVGNIIGPGSTPFIGTTEKTDLKTPPSLLKPVLFGVAALVALNFLT